MLLLDGIPELSGAGHAAEKFVQDRADQGAVGKRAVSVVVVVALEVAADGFDLFQTLEVPQMQRLDLGELGIELPLGVGQIGKLADEEIVLDRGSGVGFAAQLGQRLAAELGHQYLAALLRKLVLAAGKLRASRDVLTVAGFFGGQFGVDLLRAVLLGS